MSHALIRTNPTGQFFIGYCRKCGEENLTLKDGFKDCPMDDVMSDTDTEALLDILSVDDLKELKNVK